jgi:glycosyltransferase involved in cell wall biosynthesis
MCLRSKTLTVIIPTWNRARYLEKNLEILDSYLKRGLDFKILVCNNGSTDNTPEVLKKYENHPNVRIINHPENIKFDRNVASGYLNFDTDFCFCLGDSKTLNFESIEKIIKIINDEDIDAIIINVHSKMPSKVKYYTDVNTLISEIGWNLTNVSSCVISKKFITIERCERYYDSLFIHFGVFIDALCAFKNTLNVKYSPDIVKEMISFPDEKQPHGWSSNLINVWVLYWFSFIMSLPWKVTLNTKRKVLYDINKNENYLSPKKFLLARINRDKVFIDNYKRNRRLMPFVSTTPLFVYDFISKAPNMLFLWMRPLMKMIPKQRGKLK